MKQLKLVSGSGHKTLAVRKADNKAGRAPKGTEQPNLDAFLQPQPPKRRRFARWNSREEDIASQQQKKSQGSQFIPALNVESQLPLPRDNPAVFHKYACFFGGELPRFMQQVQEGIGSETEDEDVEIHLAAKPDVPRCSPCSPPASAQRAISSGKRTLELVPETPRKRTQEVAPRSRTPVETLQFQFEPQSGSMSPPAGFSSDTKYSSDPMPVASTSKATVEDSQLSQSDSEARPFIPLFDVGPLNPIPRMEAVEDPILSSRHPPIDAPTPPSADPAPSSPLAGSPAPRKKVLVDQSPSKHPPFVLSSSPPLGRHPGGLADASVEETQLPFHSGIDLVVDSQLPDAPPIIPLLKRAKRAWVDLGAAWGDVSLAADEAPLPDAPLHQPTLFKHFMRLHQSPRPTAEENVLVGLIKQRPLGKASAPPTPATASAAVPSSQTPPGQELLEDLEGVLSSEPSDDEEGLPSPQRALKPRASDWVFN